MLRADLLLGRYATVEVLHRYEGGELVRAAREDGEASVLFLPLSEALGLAAQQTLGLLAGAGIPRVTRRLESAGSTGALVLDLPPSTRPLGQVEDLPPVTLREGLIRLLVAVSRAHSRGLVHGRISRASVLACDSGEFWLVDWLGAHSPDESDTRRRGWTDVSLDLQAMARAFAAALRRETWPADSASTPGDVAPGELRFPGLGPDFGRVLGRLLSPDPRECYAGATEVLSDLGYPNTPDPWVFVPYVESDAVADVVDRHLDASTRSASEDLQHAASIEFLGPHGAGKTRALEQVARRLRERGVLVLQSSARAPGAWGGIGSVARQLAQLLGRTHAACREHVAVLDVLFGRSDSGPPDFQTAATAAISNIVSSAFADRPGALLIDDLDDLRPAELDVWSAVGRYVCAVNDDGQGVRVVLVGSRRRRGPDDVHGPREVIELREWSVARLEEFLSSVLGSAIAAEETAPALHAAAGGRPGELVEYLRHLERGGGLVREGACWRLETPLHELGSWTPGIAEYVRRSVASCPREARSLVEVLSSAEHARLSRGDCGQLAEVTGPSLWKAADDAIAAGLLRMDGSSWRLRTEAIRRKVYASLPDARRRSLHRELLFRLLRREPQDCVAIAHHARSCGDASAAEWTSRALTQLEAANDCTGAIRALEHAAESLGEPDWGRTQRLRIAVLQRQAGRLRGSVETLERVIADPLTPPPIEAEARLRLAEAHFHAREWDAVLSVELPRHTADPDLLAQIRLLRATSLTYLQSVAAARREVRLALAELGKSVASPAVRLLLHQIDCGNAFAAARWGRARRILLRKLRLAASVGARRALARDLVRYANVHRFLLRFGLAERILRRAEALLDAEMPDAKHLRVVHANTLGWVSHGRGNDDAASQSWDRAYHLALQSGMHAQACALRLRLAIARRTRRRGTTADRMFILRFLTRVRSLSCAELIDTGVAASDAALHEGLQDALDWLSTAFGDGDSSVHRVRIMQGNALVGRLILGAPLDHPVMTFALGTVEDVQRLCDAVVRLCGRTGDAEGVLRSGDVNADSDFALAVPAYLLQSGEWGSTIWPSHWTAERVFEWLTRTPVGVGGSALALALALWAPLPWNESRWRLILDAVRGARQALPLALAWQAALVESHWSWRRGRAADARVQLENARQSLLVLSHPACGPFGAAAAARGLGLVEDCARRRASTASAEDRHVAQTTSAAEAPQPWQGATQVWAASAELLGSVPRIVLCSQHARELGMFLGLACCSQGAFDTCPALVMALDRLCVYLPNLMSPREIDDALARTRAALHSGRGILLALSNSPAEFRGSSAACRLLFDLADGARAELPPLCGAAEHRLELFTAALGVACPGIEIGPRARLEVDRYGWPGGVSEMESVAAAVAATGQAAVSMKTLESLGWQLRVAQLTGAALDETEAGILNELRADTPRSLGEIAGRLGRPRRTTLRHLSRLLERGLVRRIGRARATRYSLAQGPVS